MPKNLRENGTTAGLFLAGFYCSFLLVRHLSGLMGIHLFYWILQIGSSSFLVQYFGHRILLFLHFSCSRLYFSLFFLQLLLAGCGAAGPARKLFFLKWFSEK